MEKDIDQRQNKKQRVSFTQKTLFECNAIKKVSHDKKGKRILSDFNKNDIKDITGTEYGKGVPFLCEGCGKNFRNNQGLSAHKVQ